MTTVDGVAMTGRQLVDLHQRVCDAFESLANWLEDVEDSAADRRTALNALSMAARMAPAEVAHRLPDFCALYEQAGESYGFPALMEVLVVTTVFIMRGLPGAGKSTRVRAIKREYTRWTVCSADAFFIGDDGVYRFDPALIGQAHEACWQKFQDALARGVDAIVVDNTNTQRWEYQRNVDAAKAAGADVKVINLYDGGRSDAELAERNIHGVPLASIQRMRARWEA
jgi:predicted kinase